MKLKKIVSVSSQNQITIPKVFVELLKIEKQVFLEIVDNKLVITSLKEITPDKILEELLSKGLNGTELLKKFKKELNKNNE